MNTNIVDNQLCEYEILKLYHRSSFVLGFLFVLFFWYNNAWFNLIAPVLFVLLVAISVFFVQINKFRLSSILLVISLWLAPAWCVLFSGGLYSPLFIWLAPPIFMAGVLLGSQWALFIGMLSFIFIVVTFFYNENLIIFNEFYSSTALNVLFLLSGSSAVVLITFYGYVFTRDLKNKSVEVISSRDAAIAANQVKSEFLSSMSHELRTPMNAILGFGQLLELDDEGFSESQRRNITEILNAGNHLLYLISEILDLGKIESGKLDVSIENVAIDEVLQQCIPLIQTQAKARQIELFDNLSNKGYVVYADLIRLKQVLLNLLSNAVKYNQPHGCITIDGKIIDYNRLCIRVTDTGEGLSETEITKLFIPFERLNKTHKVDGVGIGLVISKKIVELMEGTIGIDSELGKGCTFWVELPIVTN